MGYTIAEIATAIGAEAVGDTALNVDGLAEPADAGSTDLALAANPKYADQLAKGAARAAMLWPDADWTTLGLDAAIIPARPRFAMAGLTALMDPGPGYPPGIHETAIIDPSVHLGQDVTVGPFATIAANAEIGDGSVIGPYSFVGQGAVLGAGCFLRDHVSIGPRCRIGDRFIAQPGARIGGDGFSFVTAEKSAAETTRETLSSETDSSAQPWHRIHSLGAVEIGDDVEVGANASVDAGTIRPTRIGSGTKIDSNVMVAHNVVVGRDCLLCGLVGIAGSASIGNGVVLAGQVGVADNITIGDNVIVGAGSKVLSNIPAGRAMLGYPATKMDAQIEGYKALRRLPRALDDLRALKKAVFKDGTSD